MPVSYIYGLRCDCHPESGIRYVGSTHRQLSDRLREHLKPGWVNAQRYPVTKWIYKHGRDNILIECIEECDPEELDSREVYWIATYRGLKEGMLNLADGGRSSRSSDVSDEQKSKISQSLKDYYRDNPNPFKGRTHTAASRQKMSKSASGRKLTDESKRKISESSKGKTVGEETRAKLSVLNAGSRNPSAKIDRETAERIWAMLNSTDSSTPLAHTVKELGVSKYIVSNIKNGLSWRDVTGLENKYGHLS
jgi:group I intron endonuclease